MISLSEFPIKCKQKPDSKPVTENGWLNSSFSIQKNRRNAEKQANKGQETKRFDKFVITGRFVFIGWETERYKPTPGDLEGLNEDEIDESDTEYMENFLMVGKFDLILYKILGKENHFSFGFNRSKSKIPLN